MLPPTWAHVFLPAARLFKYAFEDLGIRAEIIEFDGSLNFDWHLVMGWNLYREPFGHDSRYVLFQTEPLCLLHWQKRLLEQWTIFKGATAIWDYSSTNLPKLHGLPARWLPLGYHAKLRDVELKSASHEYDVLFVGLITPRRGDVLTKLANHCSVSMQPRWGNDFRQALANAKIVLNIHQYDIPTPLEQPRVAYALNQGSFVLTETSLDDPYPWLPDISYASLVDQVLHYLHRPRERVARQSKTFTAFTSMPMKECVREAVADLMAQNKMD